MKEQFNHNLTSSFYLWFDNRLTDVGEAIITGKVQNFKYANGINTPSNMNAFYSSERQFCADDNYSQNSIYIDGTQYTQTTTGNNKVIIDNNQGRVLLSKTFATGGQISGVFAQKEINLYITNDTEEEILLKNEFYVSSGQTYSESINEMAKARYAMPCVFLSHNYSKNDGFAIGGLRDTTTYIKAVVFAKSNYQLDGVLSLFRDSAERCFKIIDQNNFPYGEYWHIKNYPYTYTGLIATGSIDTAFINNVEVYKLRDSAQTRLGKIRKDLYIGYIDFDISCIRTII